MKITVAQHLHSYMIFSDFLIFDKVVNIKSYLTVVLTSFTQMYI